MQDNFEPHRNDRNHVPPGAAVKSTPLLLTSTLTVMLSVEAVNAVKACAHQRMPRHTTWLELSHVTVAVAPPVRLSAASGAGTPPPKRHVSVGELTKFVPSIITVGEANEITAGDTLVTVMDSYSRKARPVSS